MNRAVFSILLVALLLLPLLSVVPVRASVGSPALGVVDSKTAPTNIVIANFNVSIKAGSELVEKIDGVAVPPGDWYFTIIFAVNDTWLVVFSGSQFDLYISKDGYSAISDGDIMYAGPFYVADLSGAPRKVTIKNPALKNGEADFWIGKYTIGTTEYCLLIGPIPFDITAEYRFIKIFDGIATSVAVSKAYLDILPSISLTPTEGPGGGLVTLKGVALLPNELLNLSYIAPADIAGLIAQVVTDSKGKFSYTWNIADLGRDFTGYAIIPSDTVTIEVMYNDTAEVVGTVDYTEYRRAFVWFYSELYGDEVGPAAAGMGYGNDTVTVDVYIHDTLWVAGTYFNPTAKVSFLVDGTSIGQAVCNATGFFNTTLTIPELSMGTHVVTVRNAGVEYIFRITVHPTLELVPDEGTVDTLVTCYAYGFPEGLIYIYWNSTEWGVITYYNLVNGTVGPDGRFNVTVQFVVPHAYGGIHEVIATDTWTGSETGSITGIIAIAIFTVKPRLWVEPSVFSNNGSLVYVYGDGFDPRTAYTPNIDNVYMGVNNDYFWTTPVWTNETGDLVIAFVAAGFRPGLHVISLYPEGYEPPYVPAIYATFTVTTEGDVIAGQLTGLATLVSEGFASLSNLVSTGFSTIEEDLATISDKLDDILTAIQSLNLTTINNKLDQVINMLSDLSEDVDALTSTVEAGFADVMDELSSLSDAVAGLSDQLSAVEASVLSAISGVSDDLADLSDNVEAGFADVMTTLDDLSAAVAGLSDDLASVSADLKLSIGDLKSTLTGAISSAESSIKSSVDDAVSTLTGAINGVKSAVDGISSAVEGVSSKIDTLSSDLADFRKTAEASSKDLSTYVLASAVLVIIVLILSAITLAKVYKK